MTKEEAIKALKSNYPSSCYTMLREAVDMAIEALSNPSLPSNLDEAAEEYEHNLGLFEHINLWPITAFKAGAEWMAGQGVSWEDKMTYYDGFLIYGQDERAYTMEGDFNEGDKVVVQIRKK